MRSPSTEALEVLREDGGLTLYRGMSTLALVLTDNRRESLVARLEREFAQRDLLDERWSARPLRLVTEGNAAMLRLTDPGGQILSRRIGHPWETSVFLRVAVGIASALGNLHRAGLMHRDLKPGNVFVDFDTGSAWLAGFAFASRLSHDGDAFGLSPNVIAGTLAYMAPEQTGRMNRSTDSRSDLYALGVMFYEMLCGALPFSASDPLEWIHCHVARQAVHLSERLPTVPAMLAAIVMKLLAKAGEDRYQTAAGLEADLRRCQREWESGARITGFRLGAEDVSGRLVIPDKLYGRAAETATLLGAFERVARGAVELTLVSGCAGIGKSSVVAELHKAIVPARGIFVSGKFDQRLRDQPCSTLAEAFRGLIRRILDGDPAHAARWKQQIADALGSRCSLLFELLPELATLMGPQPPLPALSPAEATLRFQSAFIRFVSTFACEDHPLVVFLDDLQWMDSATLSLVEGIAIHPQTRNLHLIGAYRDDEVTIGHALMKTVAAIRAGGRNVEQLELRPLNINEVRQFVADALRLAPHQARPLAKLLHERTGGNPLFAGQLVASLEEEGFLTFDAPARQWNWDARGIEAKSRTGNLLDLMIRRLWRLPAATRQALQVLSCIGRRAEFVMLAALCGSAKSMHAHFGPAIEAGLILADETGYHFLHDRAQEGAYALIPEPARRAMHLEIGRALSRLLSKDALADKVFDVANQLNLGLALVSDGEERVRIAEIGLQAARKAKASTGYEAACNYLLAGAAALGSNGWDHAYELAFALRLELVECEISRGHVDAAAVLVDEMIGKSRSRVDRAQAIVHRMTLQMMRGEVTQAVQTAIGGLGELEQAVSEKPTPAHVRAEFEELCQAMNGMAIEDLASLPMMDDPEMAAAMSIMVRLGLAAYFTDANLHRTIAIRLVRMTLAHGLSESSVYGCSGLGSCLGAAFDRHADGERFARAAVAIAEKGGYLAFKAGACVALQEAALWTRPVSEAVAWLDESIKLAKATGAVFFGCYAVEHRLTDLLFRGDPLDAIWNESVAALSFARKSRVQHVSDIIGSIQDFTRALRGVTNSAPFEEGESDARIQESDIPMVACIDGILQVQRLFLLGDHAGALAFCGKLTPILWSSQCHVQTVQYRVFHSLAIAASYPQADTARQREWRAMLEANVAMLARWAANCPSSFSHKHALVAAELARVEGRGMRALQLYEQAIRLAADNGFVQDRALSCELAAAFCLSQGLEAAGRAHLREARQGYLLWAAHAKVALLDERYPGIEERAASAQAPAIEASLEHFDLAAIIKGSQALSGEIVHARLIEKLMSISLEHASAERGLLIVRKADGLFLEAIACSSADGVSVEKVYRPLAPTDLPDAMLQHVLATRSSVTLNDARQANPFSHDDYLQQKNLRSILCLPLVKQRKLIGVLYFENNLVSHVFTPARHALLDLLASQAAISLQNADLYARLEQEVVERKQSEAALRQSEERYALAIEAAADGHADWIVESDTFYCSPRWLEQWGLPPELAITHRQQMLDLFPWHPEDRPRVLALLDQVRETGANRLELDTRVIVRGEVRWMHGTTLYLRDSAGKLLRASTVTTDITARRRAEDELRASEERYALAMAGSNEGVFDWDLRTGNTYLPARTQELLGLPVADPWKTREEWEALLTYHPGDLERMDAALAVHFASQTPYDQEVRFILPGGQIRCFRVRGTALRDADGKPYRMVGSLEDITERKRQQDEMQRLEGRLRQAERFEAMGTLAGGIAHDFNNLLGAILGFGERALRTAEEDSRLHHDIGNVIVAAERGRTLVERILSFSRGSGERVPVHVEKVVREALVLLQAKLPPRITLQTELRAGRAALHGDATQIHQLLMNIGTNAVQAMPNKGTLSVALDATEVRELRQATVGTVAPGAWLILEVADDGTGIPADILHRIFDPFFTTKEATVGTGLGLSLVLRIVKEVGGAIDVQSEPGLGTKFTIYLPRAGDAPEEPRHKVLSAPAGQGQRVLIVDDEEPLLELTTDTLRELGYQPTGFVSASAALRAFQADPGAFDALITDQRMPGMSGDKLIREVRRVRPLIPVILISGYASDITASRSDNAWSDEVLIKPLRTNTLATSLAHLLGSS